VTPRSAFEAAFRYDSDVQPYGKTVSQVIADGTKRVQAEDRATIAATDAAAKSAAAAELAKSELAKDIEIRPSAFSIKRGVMMVGSTAMDAPYDDIDVLEFKVWNHGRKVIESFAADAVLSNQGGDEVFQGVLSAEEPIVPGTSITVHIDHKPFGLEGQRARATTIGKLIVRYRVTRIQYADGSEAST
jgi:hypothetical protein